MTVHARIAAARARLREAGLPRDEADLSARVLAAHVLGWDAARLLASGADPEPNAFAERYEGLVARRAAREPTAYLTGRQEFWGLAFRVSPAVLIPRPETELVVEASLDRTALSAARPLAIADVCTGSGCLAVALARERPAARVVATDVSAGALAVARANAAAHGVDSRVLLVRADLLDGIDATFDLIVCNPPYVPDADRETLQPEVRDHEPPLALFAGARGLDVVARLVGRIAPRLRRGATLVLEIGYGQAAPVTGLIERTPGLKMIATRRDLSGIERVAVIERT